ncbi:hypothetical protein O6H91_19G004900 [Diphasiastrum complanatum]|uniref:Uncharacterized protein n=1 Tax=Diphasiastrum complanatum TaxID=34168 RepID=A0ACC2ASC2_DIPCM|nr:hypothetical protein O6H91_Y559900 [Diphasiastrum complanatum]KAJ7520413.1 hypothetical protein O6H91_19G004900 [Diphasiastrum complanatum]
MSLPMDTLIQEHPPSNGKHQPQPPSTDQRDDAHQFMQQQLRGQELLWEIIFGGVTSLTLRAMAMLGVPEILAQERPGASLSAAQIAARLPNCAHPNVDALDRILKYLAGRDVFQLTGSDEEPQYGLNHVSSCLVGNVGNLSPILFQQTHEVSLAAWNHLHEVVLESCEAFERGNGKPIFAYAREHPDYSRIINDSMACSSKCVMAAILKHYKEFTNLTSLVDVGGGVGTALSEIVFVYPHIKAINFDQPHVVGTAPSISGVEHVGGDMFDSVPSADGIFIKNTLMDWDDEKCIKVLRNCYKALPKNGKIMIVETIAKFCTKNGLSNKMALFADITMLAYTNGGRGRSEKQWRNLLVATGFTEIKIFELPLPVSIIEAFAK